MRPLRTTSSLKYWLGLSALFLGCTSRPSTATPYNNQTDNTTAAGDVEPLDDDLPILPPDPRERALAEAASVLLQQTHILQRRVDDGLSQEAFPKFLEQLDGGKLLLLQSHVDTLSRYKSRMDDELIAGNLVLARKGAALVLERRRLIAELTAELLSKPFDLKREEELEIDPEKRGYCKTETELKDRWRKVLKLQTLERIQQLTDLAEGKTKPDPDAPPAAKNLEIPPTLEGREKKAREELATRYSARFTRLQALEPLDPVAGFINGVNAAYDPHTQYLPPADEANFNVAISGRLEGIGAALGEEDHFIVVRELVPGGASWQQGELEAGDLILAVAQADGSPVDVTDMPIDKVVEMIRGPKGTVVTLTVKKPDGRIRTISITRDIIRLEASYARAAMLDLGPKHDPVGYIFLPGFYGEMGKPKPGERNATEDVRKLLKSFTEKKVGSVILDLRGNGGGLLSHARDISGLFVQRAPVVQTRDSKGEISVLADMDPSVEFSGTVVVIVDRFSASAAEILAAALQDYERAVIVGTGPTHGKGTVQAVIDLDRLASGKVKGPLGLYKITVEQYFRVNGASVQLRGVAPDVVLPDPVAFVESGERELFHPIPWSSVKAVPFPKSAHSWTVAELAKKSSERVAKDPLFAKVTSFTKLVKAQRDDTTEPLAWTTYMAEKKRVRDELDAADPKLSKHAPLFSVTPMPDAAAAAAAAKDPKLKKKLDDWRDELARDPWIFESLHVAADMK